MSARRSGTISCERRINLIQGEQHVASDQHVVFTTILGSCVAACLRDSVAGIGGMNHFLLPGDSQAHDNKSCNAAALRYGVHAMELLVNKLLQNGAQRGRLEAKLFGGACMMKGLTDVGELNAAFAERFLKDEGITVVGGSLRGNRGRRIQFWPVSGRARQMVLGTEQQNIFHAEVHAAPTPSIVSSGSVELF